MTSARTGHPVVTRTATPDDLPELLRLERAAFLREDWFPAYMFRRLLLRVPEGHPILVAHAPRHPSILLGDILLYFRKGSHAVRIYNLVVDPASHGMGIGSVLLNAAIRLAQARGCNKLTLEVRASNQSAIEFYTRRGFSTVTQLSGYYPNGEAALKMACPIP